MKKIDVKNEKVKTQDALLVILSRIKLDKIQSNFQKGLTENVDSSNGTKTSPKAKESDGCCTIS